VNPDALYAALVDLHRGLDDDESALAEARLTLLLAEALGDVERVRRLVAEARAIFDKPPG
jgi:Protein of unknown function (DUF2783)